VVALAESTPTEALYDWDQLCGLLAATESAWPPGSAHGESALFYGHLVGEMVRRVSGKSLGTVLRERICGPLGLDFAIGLQPADEQRGVELTTPIAGWHAEMSRGRPALYDRAIGNSAGAWDLAVVNGTRWRQAEIPAINGHGTARAVAGLFAALRDGRLLSAGLLQEATAPRPADEDLVIGGQKAWGLGIIVEDEGFGMGGTGGSIGWTTRESYAIGFVTGTLADHTRCDQVENSVRDCLGLPPL
jgi:CubicO group peptidase (beta-lactamase class C family)